MEEIQALHTVSVCTVNCVLIRKTLDYGNGFRLISKHRQYVKKSKAVPLHAMEALGGREDIAPTHFRPRHYMG
jgi:hypothetical protein